jgi:hypothetical protein
MPTTNSGKPVATYWFHYKENGGGVKREAEVLHLLALDNSFIDSKMKMIIIFVK